MFLYDGHAVFQNHIRSNYLHNNDLMDGALKPPMLTASMSCRKYLSTLQKSTSSCNIIAQIIILFSGVRDDQLSVWSYKHKHSPS